jgi:hypothetical protein
MAIPSLSGPHSLSTKIIERTITRKSPGVYLLSAVEDGVVSVRRVGRSNDDVAAHLKECIGLYSQFAFAYASSRENAYEIECVVYHSMKPPENTKHPGKPADAVWRCPLCGQ